MAQLLFVFSRRGAVCCCFALFSFVVFLFPCCLGPSVCSASRRPCDTSTTTAQQGPVRIQRYYYLLSQLLIISILIH